MCIDTKAIRNIIDYSIVVVVVDVVVVVVDAIKPLFNTSGSGKNANHN